MNGCISLYNNTNKLSNNAYTVFGELRSVEHEYEMFGEENRFEVENQLQEQLYLYFVLLKIDNVNENINILIY